MENKAGYRLQEINNRIAQKKNDYQHYNFSQDQNDILKTFFDLAQEYTSLEDFYRISVLVLKVFMGVEARLYLLNESLGILQCVCDSTSGFLEKPEAAPDHVRKSKEMYSEHGSIIVPVISKTPESARKKGQEQDLLLGMLEVEAPGDLSVEDQFFLGKFANRIGYNLYNRQISQQNIKHIQFINNLVVDIEHNVIIPNMYFKHLFNQIRKKIKDVEDIEGQMVHMKDAFDIKGNACEQMIGKVSVLHQDLIDYHQEMLKHHSNCSLFLESLFRRDHFEKGHLVLHSKKCFLETEVILPQLEQYSRRLARQKIEIDRPADMSAEQIPLRVDIGLLSQVYANFFSNAVKYTEEIIDHQGKPRKALAYGRQLLIDYFGPGRSGMKFNVFTTGHHLDAEDAEAVFNEGFRGKNIALQSGSGHGLNFVKQVVEIHNGEAGYEPTKEGNNFFFILPIDGS